MKSEAYAFRPAEVKWRLMVASCYRRIGMSCSVCMAALTVQETISMQWILTRQSTTISQRILNVRLSCTVYQLYVGHGYWTKFVYFQLEFSTRRRNIFSLMSIAGLRFLVRLCTDMGLSDVQEYAARLKRVEKSREAKDKVYVYVWCSDLAKLLL